MKALIKNVPYGKPYLIFLALSILGVIDISPRKPLGLGDEGVVGFVFAFPFVILLGNDIGATVWVLISMGLSFTLIYIILTIYFYRKMKKASTKQK